MMRAHNDIREICVSKMNKILNDRIMQVYIIIRQSAECENSRNKSLHVALIALKQLLVDNNLKAYK